MNYSEYRNQLCSLLDRPLPQWQMLRSWVDSVICREDALAAQAIYDGMTRHIEATDREYFALMAIESYFAWLMYEPYKQQDTRAEDLRNVYDSARRDKIEREHRLGLARERASYLTSLALAERARKSLELAQTKAKTPADTSAI
jgi:hypothetical protein